MSDFNKIVEKLISRREFITSSTFLGLNSFVFSSGALLSTACSETVGRDYVNFKPIASNTSDSISLAEGFNWNLLVSWGDPLWSSEKKFNEETRGSETTQRKSFGDNNDGMALFSKDGHNILAVNNEYTDLSTMFGNNSSNKPETKDDVFKAMAAHGISIIEIRLEKGKWVVVKDSKFNRRIFPDTLIDITGPARGHDLLITKSDPNGTLSLGTWNNCGNGRTPWGTYLTCEENFNGYFSSSDKNFQIPPEMKRYGIKAKDWGYKWATVDDRFDISKNPNEVNKAGYIVEIDPLKPHSKPRKLTALGRFKHENAELVISKNGEVVVYMGDDAKGEFLYRYVSNGKYSNGDRADLLENGKMYAARFNENNTGEWLELSTKTTGMSSQAEICVFTRQAASLVGATTMDRPEWVSSSPVTSEVCCCLTNNKNRGKKPNSGGDATPINGPNPRKGNNYGQIVRWIPDNQDHASNKFKWDLFVLVGNPKVHSDLRAGSKNINKENIFNSPDGLCFDSNGFLWIQTDGRYSNRGDYEGMGNNQMLLGNPQTGEIKRFMVGPRECEVTGITWSEDKRTLFVGIQHPGERGNSHFPGGRYSLPRSSVITIQKNDGSIIG